MQPLIWRSGSVRNYPGLSFPFSDFPKRAEGTRERSDQVNRASGSSEVSESERALSVDQFVKP